MEMVTAMLGQINAPNLTDNGDDYLSWNPGNNFSVKSCYDAIEVAGRYLPYLPKPSHIANICTNIPSQVLDPYAGACG
ncbi:hypothetical protein MKW98_013833 [Papaver atlanticum]|uniref:Uncharacterized protein n=1 Tax=Papaver atlanticum TaxID=357466 RepID=A0AAD4TDS1_9MAGN|nr:hypothetical protein MKW98_013833 [Papaver atlanticum]